MLRTIAVLSILAASALAFACDGNGDGSSPTNTSPAATDSVNPADGASSTLPQGDEPVELDPANFVAEIDNPYWPMKPGNRWVSNETDADGNLLQVEVTVTTDKREILGISATVVHDVVTQDGEVLEDTFDWYAQDVDGNIWYMGEDTKEYEDGVVVSTEGSWEAGVDGAQAGVAVPGNPEAGMTYRQEYYAGEAEDQGKVLSLDEHVEVPYGTFDGCLQTEDTTALEPDVLEHKYYCAGVGPVLAVDVASGGGREELVTFEEGAQ
ncbi:MAG: hypothetical protein WEE64_02340 [Dehalococcoidia bacterium]